MKMNKSDFEQFLTQSLNDTKHELTPEKDLWPGVERALAKSEAAKPVKNGWNKLAAIAACTVAALLTAQLFIKTPQTNSVVAMSDFFAKQKQSLLVQYEGSPAVTDNWQQQLSELEEAESAIKQALENEPNNSALLSMLAQVYQQQLDLINKVHAPKWQTI